MDLSPAIASTIAAAISVPLFMALMRRIKILRHRADSSKSFEQLAREYANWERLAVLLVVLLVGLIGFFIRAGLEAIYNLQLSYQEPGVFTLSLPSILWWIPAFFFALFIASIPLHYLYLAMLGRQRYAEYIEYGNQKFEINSWKLLRYLANVLIPLCLAMTFLALDSYVRVTDEAFIVNRFFGVGETSYRFERLQKITLVKSFTAPNGNVLRNWYYVIGFDDDTAFEFHKSPFEMDFQRQQILVDFLLDATALKIVVDDPYPP